MSRAGLLEPKEFDPSQSSIVVNWARVMSHVIKKGFQAGGVVGLGAVVPVVAYKQIYREGKPLPDAIPSFAEAIYRTVLATLAISVTLGVTRLAALEDKRAAYEDRAYRLHYNQGQNRADLFANIGTVAGGAAAIYFLPASAAVVVGSAAAGAAAGVFAHVLTAPKRV